MLLQVGCGEQKQSSTMHFKLSFNDIIIFSRHEKSFEILEFIVLIYLSRLLTARLGRSGGQMRRVQEAGVWLCQMALCP